MQLCNGKLTLTFVDMGPAAWAFDEKIILTIWDNPTNAQLAQFRDQTIQLHILPSRDNAGSHELEGVPSHEDGKRSCFIPIKIPSKSNTYQIRFNKAFWKAIQHTVEKFRTRPGSQGNMRNYWIGPSEEVERAEVAIAYYFKVAEKREWLKDEPLALTVTLINQNADIDNTLKVICDGIEKSGRIKNDKQFSQILVRREKRVKSKPAIELLISPANE